jgi:hypothetical protein
VIVASPPPARLIAFVTASRNCAVLRLNIPPDGGEARRGCGSVSSSDEDCPELRERADTGAARPKARSSSPRFVKSSRGVDGSMPERCGVGCDIAATVVRSTA